MSEEIKEILEDVKRHLDYVNATGLKSTRDNKMKAMYDYITNLQENYERIYNENCKLREEHNITDISLLDENNRLKEENIKLKELCDKYEEEHSTKFNEWVFDKRENEMLKLEIERLNNIIKEVRELLKNDYFEDGSFTNYKKVFELLDKGSDKE